MVPPNASGPSSSSPPANSSPVVPSHGVNGPVCGPPVPTFGTRPAAAAPAPVAVPAAAVSATTAAAKAASSANLILTLTLIPLPIEWLWAARPPATAAHVTGRYAGPDRGMSSDNRTRREVDRTRAADRCRRRLGCHGHVPCGRAAENPRVQLERRRLVARGCEAMPRNKETPSAPAESIWVLRRNIIGLSGGSSYEPCGFAIAR